MAFRPRFAAHLAWRTALLFAAMIVATLLGSWGRAPVATILAVTAVVVALAALWRAVDAGNADLARFVAALDRGDFTQSFARPNRGSHFDRLGDAYERALARLRDERAARADAIRFAETLADSAPVALLVLDPDGRVTIANAAARRLFGRDGTVPLAALDRFGPVFVADLAAALPGTSRLSRLAGEGIPQRVSLDTTAIDGGGGRRCIVAVRVVQPELDRAELTAQIDLVRVLTHEIMNSLTPVTSLAATAHRITQALDPALAPGIADAQLAAATLARRAVELERFVESYKGFSEAPVLTRAPIVVADWLEQVLRLFRATPLAEGIALDISVTPDTPPIHGDVALLTQVLLNLLKNAAEAAAGGDRPAIRVVAAPRADGRIGLAMADSGPGVPAPLREEVFLPFFTTKRTGTGIGLSFARQIVLLHGGQIAIRDGDASCVDLTLGPSPHAAIVPPPSTMTVDPVA